MDRLPRFSCEEPDALRRRRAAGTLYANPAVFRDEASCYIVTARGAPELDEEFRVELAPAAAGQGPSRDTGWLSGEGDMWPTVLRAFATGRARLEVRGSGAELVLDTPGGRVRIELRPAGDGEALRLRWEKLMALRA